MNRSDPPSPFASGSPATLGYRMPAEWERHAGTWLSWPYNMETWEGHLEGAEEAFAEIIRALAPHETVHLAVANAEIEARAVKKLKGKQGNLVFHRMETGDVWFRDYGPTFLVREHGGTHEIAYAKWTYNAYGNKYQDLLIGNDVPDKMPLAHARRFDAGIVLEGGSIDVNGTGSLLTTESCLLHPDRNPGLTKADIEQKLRDYLGVTNVLWLKEGIAGDDTDGHIDDIARFTGKRSIVTVVEGNPRDENYAPLQENLHRLRSMHDEEGSPLEVSTLPMPDAFTVDGRRMAASYANFYIANNVVLVPIYKQSADAEALKVLQSCFKDRTILGIDCRELIWGYGSIHCATQQRPA